MRVILCIIKKTIEIFLLNSGSNNSLIKISYVTEFQIQYLLWLICNIHIILFYISYVIFKTHFRKYFTKYIFFNILKSTLQNNFFINISESTF